MIDTFVNNKLPFKEGKIIDSIDNVDVVKLKEKYKFSNISKYAYSTPLTEKQVLFLVSYKYDEMITFLAEKQNPWLTILVGEYPRSVQGMGFILKKGKRYKLLNLKQSTRYFTPINSESKALEYICFMEMVQPIFDFSFLKKEKDIFFYKQTINPTRTKKNKNGYIINLFYYENHTDFSNLISDCYEIVYKVDRKGNITILSKHHIFTTFDEE